jgi:ribosomal protein S6
MMIIGDTIDTETRIALRNNQKNHIESHTGITQKTKTMGTRALIRTIHRGRNWMISNQGERKTTRIIEMKPRGPLKETKKWHHLTK